MIGIDTAADGVQRQLADGDGQPAITLITDAENRRGVGGDDHAHIVPWEIAYDLGGAVDVQWRERQPARILVQMAELLHRLTDGRGIDNRHHLFEMAFQQGIEQGLGAFLQGAQVLVLGDRVGFAQEAAINPLDLLFQRIDLGRQQSIQPQRDPLILGECGTLVA